MTQSEMIRWMDEHSILSTLMVAGIYVVAFVGFLLVVGLVAALAAGFGEAVRS